MHRIANPRRAGLLALAATSALVVGSTAMAAQPQTFEEQLAAMKHVRWNHVPQAATPVDAEQASGGLKAYIDSETGEFRGPTQEELEAEAAAAATPSTSKTVRAAAARAPMLSPNGGTKVMLDASSMQNVMVVRRADGSLAEICQPATEDAETHLKHAAAITKGDFQ